MTENRDNFSKYDKNSLPYCTLYFIENSLLCFFIVQTTMTTRKSPEAKWLGLSRQLKASGPELELAAGSGVKEALLQSPSLSLQATSGSQPEQLVGLAEPAPSSGGCVPTNRQACSLRLFAQS